MNIFRLVADLLHLSSIIILLLQLYGHQSCSGISLKTQVLYVVIFCCRYADIFWNFWSIYNWVLKVFFIASSITIAYWMKYKSPINKSYDQRLDDFQVWILIIPCFILSLFFNVTFTPFEIAWAFSIYLESVSIMPQLHMVQKFARENLGTVKNITSHYMFCLGAYRALYVANWVVRYMTEPNYWDPIAWVSGIVQTSLYCDFFYYYVKARYTGKAMELPV